MLGCQLTGQGFLPGHRLWGGHPAGRGARGEDTASALPGAPGTDTEGGDSMGTGQRGFRLGLGWPLQESWGLWWPP